jgi:predicted RNA-binding protein with EMAP domain
MPDTSRDRRILLVERLLGSLRDQVQRRLFGSRKQTSRALALLEELSARVSELRYCYLDDEGLAGLVEEHGFAERAAEVAAELERNPGVTPLRRAQLGFFAALLGRFAAALRSGGGLEQLVPVEVGEVRSVERIKGARDLRLCRVAVFGAVLPIVTNLTETRKGALMKVARVPPVELMGVLSEGQFLGPAAAHEAAGSEPELTPRDAQEIRKSLGTLLES